MTKSEYREKYHEFEKKYNPYPVQMSRAEAFSKALHDGLITMEEYIQARIYAGSLWFYTRDDG